MDENKNIFNDDMRKKLNEAVNETLKVFCEVFYAKQQNNDCEKDVNNE